MEILQLKYFSEAARKENISHAAQKYMVPPSGVSASIKKLEAELGVKLFDRKTNSLKLNEKGQIFLEAVEKAEKEIKNAIIKITNLAALPMGEIKLLVLTNRRVVTELIAGFTREYADVSFVLKHEDYDDYSNYNQFDIIITDREISGDGFERRSFIEEEVFVAVSKESNIGMGGSIKISDIKDEKIICMPKGSSQRALIERTFGKYGYNPDIVIECDDPYYIGEYVKMGLGITFFPKVSWKNRIGERVRLLRLEEEVYRNSYMYINRESSDTTRLFADKAELMLKDFE